MDAGMSTKQGKNSQRRGSKSAAHSGLKMAPSLPRGEDTRLSAPDSGASEDSQDLFRVSPDRDRHALDASLLAQMRSIVREEIAVASRQITAELLKELRDIGHRTEALERRTDDVTTVLEGHESDIENLQADAHLMQDILEDHENRARRGNIRIRGLPESVEDLPGSVTALLQELIPDVPPERLEMDRVHRALSRRQASGPPRDVIAKFHFYATKEHIMQAARRSPDLAYQGHPYKIFSDLASITITKRRNLRPYLMILQAEGIKYRWGYPFRLIFVFHNVTYQLRTPEEVRSCFLKLGLRMPAEAPSSSPSRGTPVPSSPLRSPSKITVVQRSSALQRLSSQVFQTVDKG